jgi:hypothetical protein
MNSKKRIPLNVQKLLVAYVVAGLLGWWSIGVLWNHIDGLQSKYGWMMRIGVCAGEFSVFVLITWHVLRRWVWTRVYCLAASTLLAVCLVVHTAGVIKYDSSRVENRKTLEALAAGQAKIAEGAAAGINDSAVKLQQSGASPRQVGRVARSGQQQTAAVAAEANKTLASAALQADQTAKDENFLPPEYMNGAMYAVIFTLALLLLGGAYAVMEWGEEYERDADGDGIPDRQQAAGERPRYPVDPGPALATAALRQQPSLRADLPGAVPIEPPQRGSRGN